MTEGLHQQLLYLPLFCALTDNEARRMATVVRPRRCARGEALFAMGDPAHGIYIVMEGLVKIYQVAADGHETVLHLIPPGQSCGDAAVFLRGVYPANGQAVRASRLLYVPGEALIRSITDNPGLALRMLAALSERLQAFARSVGEREQGTAAARLAGYLLEQIGDQTNALELEISRETIGNLLGMTRETVSRELTKLRQAGVVAVQGRRITVLNGAQLRNFAQM